MDQKNQMNMSMEERNGQATADRLEQSSYQESGNTGALNHQETGRTATSASRDQELYQQNRPKGGEDASESHDKGFYQENGLNGEESRNQG